MRRGAFISGVILLLIAAASFVGVGSKFARSIRLITAGRVTRGSIVSQRLPDPSSDSYVRTVRFDASGKTWTFESEYSGETQVGDTVSVRYDPKSPRVAELDSIGALWGVPAIWLMFVTCFLALPGAALIWVARRGARPLRE